MKCHDADIKWRVRTSNPGKSLYVLNILTALNIRWRIIKGILATEVSFVAKLIGKRLSISNEIRLVVLLPNKSVAHQFTSLVKPWSASPLS